MPITVHPQTSLQNAEVRDQIERLYDASPEFSSGKAALDQLERQLSEYTVFYTAEFNTKIIGVIWSTGQQDQRKFEYIVIHPANRGRGVAERLVSEAHRLETLNGVKHFEPGCSAIQRCLAEVGV